MMQIMMLVVELQREDELARVHANPLISLHHLELTPQNDPGFWEFSSAEAMIADGRRAAQEFLAQESISEKP